MADLEASQKFCDLAIANRYRTGLIYMGIERQPIRSKQARLKIKIDVWDSSVPKASKRGLPELSDVFDKGVERLLYCLHSCSSSSVSCCQRGALRTSSSAHGTSEIHGLAFSYSSPIVQAATSDRDLLVVAGTVFTGGDNDTSRSFSCRTGTPPPAAPLLSAPTRGAESRLGGTWQVSSIGGR